MHTRLMRGSVRRGLAGAVGVVMVLVAACGDEPQDGSERPFGDVPVLDSVARGPGTELRDGLEVSPGTVLVAGVLPDGIDSPFGDITGEGWSALLFVTGEPSEVFEAYLAQAESVGMERVEAPEGAPAFLREDLPADAQRYTACGVSSEGGPAGYSCSGLATTDGGAPCLRVALVRRTTGNTVESSLRLRRVTDPDGCVGAGSQMIGDPYAEPPVLPDDWPELPAVGDLLGEAFGMLAPLEVAEGTELAVPPFWDGCGGSSALLAVSGDPMEVLTAYGSQLDALAPRAERTDVVTRSVHDGTTVHEIRRQEPAGGSAYAARVLERTEDPALLVLSACPG